MLVVIDYHQHSTFLEANKITILAVGAFSGLYVNIVLQEEVLLMT